MPVELTPEQDIDYSKSTRFSFLAPAMTFETYPKCLYTISPPDILWLMAGMTVGKLTAEEFERNLEVMDNFVKQLVTDGSQFVVVGGSPTFRAKPVGWDRKEIERLEKMVNTPVTTTATAAIDAMRHVGAKNVAIVSPYPEWVNEETKSFVEGHDMTVKTMRGMGKQGVLGVSNVPTRQTYEAIQSAVEEDSSIDTIYIPGMRMPVVEIIDKVESDLGVTMVTAAACALWAGLHRLGLHKDGIQRYGRLLREI